MTTQRLFTAGALALGVLFTTSACATGGYASRRPTSRVDYREMDRWAYNNGVNDGRQAGERDARGRAGYRLERDREYQRADHGYYSRGGYPLYQYKEMFRRGFEVGYDEGYRRYARGGRGRIGPGYGGPMYGGGSPGAYVSPASRNGYNDGLEAGRDDARSNRSYDPRRPKAYREGDRGYSNRDGSRDDYKREYRAAFQDGYEQGYRGARS